MEELWNRNLVPADCLVDDGRDDSGGGIRNGQKGKGKAAERAVAQPTGRRVAPSGKGSGREGGGPEDPRRGAAGALDGKGGANEEAAGSQKGKGKGKKGGKKEESAGEEGSNKLPPEREFVRPAKTREAMVREADVLDKRLAELEAGAGNTRTVARLQKEKEDLEKSIKVAGGKTKRTLLFSIKNEEEHQARSEKAIERCRTRIKERELQIQEIQEGIRQDTTLLERHQQREQASVQRLAFLAVQKVGESLPTEFLEKVRMAATIIKGAADNRLEPIEELLAAMLPSHEEYNIGADDAASTVAGMDERARQDEDDIDVYDQEHRQEISFARGRLAEAQRQLEQALDWSLRGKQVKRKNGEDEPKTQRDEEMPEEEVATLTPEQTADFFRQRIKEAEKELRELENSGQKEVVPVVGEKAAAGPKGGERANNEEPNNVVGGGAGTGVGKNTKEGGRAGTETHVQPADARKKGGDQNDGEGWKTAGPGKKKRASRWSDDEERRDEGGEREPGKSPTSGGARGQGPEGPREGEGISSSSSSLEVCVYRPGDTQNSGAKELGDMEAEQIGEVGKQGPAAEAEAQKLLEQIRWNTERNWEMAVQERMQQRQEQELHLVGKLQLVRRLAKQMERNRTTPY